MAKLWDGVDARELLTLDHAVGLHDSASADERMFMGPKAPGRGRAVASGADCFMRGTDACSPVRCRKAWR